MGLLPSNIFIVWVFSCPSSVRLSVTPWTVACRAPLSMGILQTGILESVALPSSRKSSWPRVSMSISYIHCIGRWFFTTSDTWKVQYLSQIPPILKKKLELIDSGYWLFGWIGLNKICLGFRYQINLSIENNENTKISIMTHAVSYPLIFEYVSLNFSGILF